MQLFDPKLMALLTFLSRRQAWLAPHEISREFQLDGENITARTIHRWFHFLREDGNFIYYPYPRSNLLGLQDVLVRVRGLRNPAVLGVLPFSASFSVEIGLKDGERHVSQSYWVPGTAMESFRDYWQAARDLGLVSEVEVFPARNTHLFYSPFEQLIREDGTADLRESVDNGYFGSLVKRNVKQKFEIRISEHIEKSPLLVPIVVEHIWSHFSSRQVWREIRAKGEERILAYGKGKFARALQRPGTALRVLQQQWSSLLRDFDEMFLQPRVFFHWPFVRNSMFVSLVLKPGSVDRMVEAARAASQQSITTSLKPGLQFEERCHISCFIPSDQLLPLLEIAREYHAGRDPPQFAVQDRKATLALFQPTFCKVDWRLFDPATLSWNFHGDRYIEHLKRMPLTITTPA